LKENLMPGGNSKIWELWADVASALGNEGLVRQCQEQAAVLKKEERDNGVEGLSRMVKLSKPDAVGLSKMVVAAAQPLMRRDPWHDKLFGSKNSVLSGFFSEVELPSSESSQDEMPRVLISQEKST
jgi:hypothetical protein